MLKLLPDEVDVIVEASAEASCRHLVQPQNWLVWICDPAKGRDLNVLKSTDRAQNRLGAGGHYMPQGKSHQVSNRLFVCQIDFKVKCVIFGNV